MAKAKNLLSTNREEGRRVESVKQKRWWEVEGERPPHQEDSIVGIKRENQNLEISSGKKEKGEREASWSLLMCPSTNSPPYRFGTSLFSAGAPLRKLTGCAFRRLGNREGRQKALGGANQLPPPARNSQNIRNLDGRQMSCRFGTWRHRV